MIALALAHLRPLLRDRRGSPAVDFALTLPALVLVTVGVMQLGIGFLANAGLRNAVEAAARYATIYTTATGNTACVTGYPTDDQIVAKVRSSAFGIDASQLTVSTPVHGTSNGTCYVDVTASYPISFKFIVISTPAFNLSYTRRAYQM